MEELIELIETQFGVDTFSLIIFIQEVELKVDDTLTVGLDHAVSCGDAKLIIKIDQLWVMHLWEKALKFRSFVTLEFEYSLDGCEDSGGVEVFGDTTFLDERRILLLSRFELLQKIYELDRIFEEGLHIFHSLTELIAKLVELRLDVIF